METLTIHIPKYNRKLSYYVEMTSIGSNISGNRKLISSGIDGEEDAESVYLIDTRDNVIMEMGNIENKIFSKWIFSKFEEYKKSNFKFGNEMYDPTEQIEIEKFFGYLKSNIREEIIDSI